MPKGECIIFVRQKLLRVIYDIFLTSVYCFAHMVHWFSHFSISLDGWYGMEAYDVTPQGYILHEMECFR